MKIAVIFPGQGSQYLGMAQEFINENDDSAALIRMAENACGLNLSNLCKEGPMEELTRATNLQPAITITNIICWHRFQQAIEGKISVSCFAGHSLGEYSALYASGVTDLADTLRLVTKRGALMEREGLKNPGGMRAVLGLDIQTIENLINTYQGNGIVTAANHNTKEQVVLSGSMEGLDALSKMAEAKGGKVIPLNVSVANHSPLVAEAVPDFTEYMADISFNSPKQPVYFNVSAQKEYDTSTIKAMMARQIASRVRWYEIIEAMIAEGIDTFVEIGPKTVLKGMMKKIVPKGTAINTLQFDTPATLASCLANLGI